MEILELEPPQFGVHLTGIYVIDDAGGHALAGPFTSEDAAIAWITRRQAALLRGWPSAELAAWGPVRGRS